MRFPTGSFNFVITHGKSFINGRPMKVSPSVNQHFPASQGWIMFRYLSGTYFIRITRKGLKVVEVKGIICMYICFLFHCLCTLHDIFSIYMVLCNTSINSGCAVSWFWRWRCNSNVLRLCCRKQEVSRPKVWRDEINQFLKWMPHSRIILFKLFVERWCECMLIFLFMNS